MTRKEMNKLQIPGLVVKPKAEREFFPRKEKDIICDVDILVKIGTVDDVTLNYAYEWEIKYFNDKAYVESKRKTIVYKFLSEEQITAILIKSLNDFNKCYKQVKAHNKKQEIEKDFLD